MRLFLVCLALLAVAACSEETADVTSTANPSPDAAATDGPTDQPTTEATTTESPAEPDVLNLEIGATADIGDASVTVNSWRLDAGTEFFKPDADKQWVVVDVTVENTGDDEYNISSLLQMAIRDSEGREHRDIAFADTSGSLDGTIPAGQTLRGENATEVPAGATGLQFVFKQSFGSEQARWKLR